jgi:acyl-CoA thioesterase II
MTGQEPVDLEDAVAQMVAFLTVRPAGGSRWVGDVPDWFGDVLFGGFVLGQSVAAVTADAPAGRRLHSFHAYFLRPVIATGPVEYSLRPVRDGRAFNSRHLVATQGGKPVVEALCSFTDDTEGYVYDVPVPSGLPARDETAAEPGTGPGPWTAHYLGPTELRDDGTYQSTDRKWFRIPVPLPDDPHLHTAMLAFASDWTGVGGRPLLLDGEIGIEGMVSLDHALWFHRPARADAWLYYDVESLVNAGGRGLLRGVMRDSDGRIVLSIAQEMKLTRI